MGICKNQIYLSGLKKEVTTRWNVWSTCTKGVGSTDRKRQLTDLSSAFTSSSTLTLTSTLSPCHPPSHLVIHPLTSSPTLSSSSTLTLWSTFSPRHPPSPPFAKRTVVLEWTPSHHNVLGRETTDALAKEGTTKEQEGRWAGSIGAETIIKARQQVTAFVLQQIWPLPPAVKIRTGDSIHAATTDPTPTTCCQDQNRWQHSCCRNRPDPYHLLSRSEHVTILWHKPRPCEPPPLHTVQNCPSRALHLSVAAWQQNILLQTCPWHDC